MGEHAQITAIQRANAIRVARGFVACIDNDDHTPRADHAGMIPLVENGRIVFENGAPVEVPLWIVMVALIDAIDEVDTRGNLEEAIHEFRIEFGKGLEELRTAMARIDNAAIGLTER